MDIVFDPAKDVANLAKHGLSLADAATFDLAGATVVEDDCADYGERPFRAFGRVDGEARCLAFTIRGTTIRPISYRRAHEKEIRRHGF